MLAPATPQVRIPTRRKKQTRISVEGRCGMTSAAILPMVCLFSTIWSGSIVVISGHAKVGVGPMNLIWFSVSVAGFAASMGWLG